MKKSTKLLSLIFALIMGIAVFTAIPGCIIDEKSVELENTGKSLEEEKENIVKEGNGENDMPEIKEVNYSDVLALDLDKGERVIYDNTNGKSLDMFVYYPEEKVKPKACMFCIHGGGWTRESAERLMPHAAYYATIGIVGVSINYTLNTDKSDIREGLKDCINAFKFIKEKLQKKYGDLNYIALGDSAGGYYAVCLGNKKIVNMVDPTAEIADYVVDLNGIVDLTGKWKTGLNGNPSQSLLEQYSPLFNVGSEDAPVLIMHGDMDQTVDMLDAENYRDALTAKGVKNELVVQKGSAHAFILYNYREPNDNVAKIMRDIAIRLRSEKIL